MTARKRAARVVCLAILTTFVSSNNSWPRELMIFGSGNRSCGAWVDAHKGAPNEVSLMQQDWMFGYIAGFGDITLSLRATDITRGTDGEASSRLSPPGNQSVGLLMAAGVNKCQGTEHAADSPSQFLTLREAASRLRACALSISPSQTLTRRPKREAWPRWLRRDDAADYVSVSPSQFDKWVADGILPKPKKIGGIVLWDRFAMDEGIEAIFYPEAEAELAVWDDVRV